MAPVAVASTVCTFSRGRPPLSSSPLARSIAPSSAPTNACSRTIGETTYTTASSARSGSTGMSLTLRVFRITANHGSRPNDAPAGRKLCGSPPDHLSVHVEDRDTEVEERASLVREVEQALLGSEVLIEEVDSERRPRRWSSCTSEAMCCEKWCSRSSASRRSCASSCASSCCRSVTRKPIKRAMATPAVAT